MNPARTHRQTGGSSSRLPVSTVHRFLQSGHCRILELTEGTHHLGSRVCDWAGRGGQLDIRRLSLPYLRELNQQTRETIHLTVRHGLSAVYVEKLDSPEPLRIHSRLGASVPLYCTAVGKVMLAYMPSDEQDRVLSQLELKRLTPNTAGSLQELKAELFRVRKNGYASTLRNTVAHPLSPLRSGITRETCNQVSASQPRVFGCRWLDFASWRR